MIFLGEFVGRTVGVRSPMGSCRFFVFSVEVFFVVLWKLVFEIVSVLARLFS